MPPSEAVGDVGPAVSSDGQTVAFWRNAGYTTGGLRLVALREALSAPALSRPVSVNEAGIVASPVWMPNRNEIVFTGGDVGVRSMWRIAASTSAAPHPLPVGGDGDLPAVSPDGRRLAYTKRIWDSNIHRLEISGAPESAGTLVSVINSTRIEKFPAVSPDGTRIACQSDRSGVHEIWVSNSDGWGTVQLTSFGRGMTGSPRRRGEYPALDRTVRTGRQILHREADDQWRRGDDDRHPGRVPWRRRADGAGEGPQAGL